VTVQLSGANFDRALVLATRSPGTQAAGDSSGIMVQAQTGKNSWQALGFVHPRRATDEFGVSLPVLSGSQARLVFYGNYEVSGVRQLEVQSQVAPTTLTLAKATQSRLGDVKAAEASVDGGTTTLQLGDTLSLSYAATAIKDGMTREFFLTALGRYLTSSPTDALAVSNAAIVVGPSWQFSLGNARPNPSSRDFTIDYSLARDTQVSIRVYDVAGRLVATLQNGPLPAGPHTVIWDGRNQDGRRIASSVYFYRMVAGSFSSQRKAVLLTQ
jgi:hypothetical protein